MGSLVSLRRMYLSYISRECLSHSHSWLSRDLILKVSCIREPRYSLGLRCSGPDAILCTAPALQSGSGKVDRWHMLAPISSASQSFGYQFINTYIHPSQAGITLGRLSRLPPDAPDVLDRVHFTSHRDVAHHLLQHANGKTFVLFTAYHRSHDGVSDCYL